MVEKTHGVLGGQLKGLSVVGPFKIPVVGAGISFDGARWVKNDRGTDGAAVGKAVLEVVVFGVKIDLEVGADFGAEVEVQAGTLQFTGAQVALLVVTLKAQAVGEVLDPAR